MNNPFIQDNTDFVLFGAQHAWMMAATIGAAICLPIATQRLFDHGQHLWLNRSFAILLCATVIGWLAIRVVLGQFDRATDLPLDICNIMAILAPFLLWNPSKEFHEIMYFWILTGTFQAILTPYLYEGFPHFTFIKYWFVHGGLVVYIIYVTVAFDLYPDIRGLWRAFGWMQVYALIMLAANWLLGSNYMYVLDKPPTSSILDYFGPWPWYLLVCEAIAVVLYFISYLPIYLWGRFVIERQ